MAALGMYSDRGKVKQVDQDACCYLEARSTAGRVIMAIVCDGVGGLSKGELASSTVVRRFADWFSIRLPRFMEYNVGDDGFMESLRNVWDTLLQMAAEDIFRFSENNDVALGTTFTGMIVVGDNFLIGHVGDCRVYEVSGSGVVQLTRDQTFVAQQVEAGLITKEEALHHPKRNVILQSVGTAESVEPEFQFGKFDPNSVYVLCCDGFYNRLEEGELQQLFSRGVLNSESDLQKNCVKAVRDIISRGEKDNITVLAFTDLVEAGIPETRIAEIPMSSGNAVSCPESRKAASSSSANLQSDDVIFDKSGDVEFPRSAREDPDEDESLTVVVDSAESPTIVVPKGGGE